MINNTVSLDFYNSHFYIRIENKEHYWDNSTKFISDTSYPYSSTTRLLSYEPNRNIYHVERVNAEMGIGKELDEIKWFTDNKQRLIPILEQLIQATIPIITIEMTRAEKLAETDWLVQRHQEQLLQSISTTLTSTQFTDLLNYKQQLRDLTNTYSKTTPTDQVIWPTNPLN